MRRILHTFSRINLATADESNASRSRQLAEHYRSLQTKTSHTINSPEIDKNSQSAER